MKPPVPLKTVLAHLDLPSLKDAAHTLLAAGRTRDQVIEDITAMVDAMIPWAEILGLVGPVGAAIGVALDAVDAPIAIAIAKLVVPRAKK